MTAEMIHYYDQMIERNIQPNDITFMTILESLGDEGKLAKMEEWYDYLIIIWAMLQSLINRISDYNTLGFRR